MSRWLERWKLPARESQLEMALAVAAAALGLMLWAVIWQADIIRNQRDVIRWLWSSRLGG